FVQDRIWPQVESQLRDAVAEAQARLLDTTLGLAEHLHRHLESIAALRVQRGQFETQRNQLQAQCDQLKAQYEQLRSPRNHPPPRSLLQARLRRLLRPRLGSLEHYPPRPLAIPARYAREAPVTSGPVISIVTPTLNSEGFLERTLHSVLDQDYAPLEYVI